VDIGSFASVEDIGLRGVGVGVAEVIHDGCVEQDGVLRDDTNMLSQAEQRKVTDIMSINSDRSAVDIVKSE
jgi:hypothetical protein